MDWATGLDAQCGKWFIARPDGAAEQDLPIFEGEYVIIANNFI